MHSSTRQLFLTLGIIVAVLLFAQLLALVNVDEWLDREGNLPTDTPEVTAEDMGVPQVPKERIRINIQYQILVTSSTGFSSGGCRFLHQMNTVFAADSEVLPSSRVNFENLGCMDSENAGEDYVIRSVDPELGYSMLFLSGFQYIELLHTNASISEELSHIELELRFTSFGRGQHQLLTSVEPDHFEELRQLRYHIGISSLDSLNDQFNLNTYQTNGIFVVPFVSISRV